MKKRQTAHELITGDARSLDGIADESIDLAVTSPPYPMIGLWDSLFISQNSEIKQLLHTGCGTKAFLLMHKLLDPVWRELGRVIKQGGFICINIGDATRRVGDDFRLYPNHALVQQRFLELGFDVLPMILWWKPTNSPTKFMGSGMLAAGAYVTLEHEYILIFRKGKKRIFTTPQAKLLRRQSALFWEERNKWYADRWDLSGVRQYLGTKGTEAERTRSAAFPLELAYRLINMYSVQGDTVIDPFAGTGTTLLASLAACRGSLGMEIDPALGSVFVARAAQFIPVLNEFILARLHAHLQFARDQETRNTPLAYRNSRYGFPVKTRQETDLFIPCINGVEMTQPYSFSATYTDQIFLQESPRPVLRPFNLFPGSALRTQATGA